MSEFETELIQQLIALNKSLGDMTAILNQVVVEGLVVIPDVPASDN